MSLLIALLTLLLLAAVILVVSAPLRAPRAGRDHGAGGEPGGPRDLSPDLERDELEAAREAKYREIRDAELDLATGKLDEADHRAIDRQLRAEAVDILRRLDALER